MDFISLSIAISGVLGVLLRSYHNIPAAENHNKQFSFKHIAQPTDAVVTFKVCKNVPPLRYTPEWLHSRRFVTVTSPTVCELSLAGIHKHATVFIKKTKRGKRAGRRKQRHIGVRSSIRPTVANPPTKRVNSNNLINIDTRNVYTQDSKCLKFLYFNAQSCGNKTIEINDLIVETNADLVFITETWITSNDTVKLNEMVPNGYDILLQHRVSRSGGGVAIIYRLSLDVSILPSPAFSTFEICCLKLKMPNSCLNCSCVYRPTASKKNNTSINSFLTDFNDFLETLSSESKVCVLGDFNIHFEKLCDPAALKLKKLLHEHSLTQLVNEPTHSGGHTLDLVITRDSQREMYTTVVSDLCLSDHFVISLSLPYHKPKTSTKVTKSRNIKSMDMNVFKSNMSQELHESMNSKCKTSLSTKFTKCISDLFNKFAPVVSRIISIRPYAPWINLSVKAQKQIRRQAERIYVKTRLTVHKDIFKSEKNKTIFVIKDEKKNYISEKIESSSSSKELFNVYNDMTGKKKTLTLPTNVPSSELPDMFNNFFIDKIDVIRNELDLVCEPPTFATYDGIVFSAFTHVNEDYVKSIIMKCKKSFSVLDPLPAKLFYECIDVMIPYITNILNESLSSGIFPTDFKESIVIPLIKKASLDCNIFKNYRPVTNLSFISKVLERVAYCQIVDHITKNKLSDMFQSA